MRKLPLKKKENYLAKALIDISQVFKNLEAAPDEKIRARALATRTGIYLEMHDGQKVQQDIDELRKNPSLCEEVLPNWQDISEKAKLFELR